MFEYRAADWQSYRMDYQTPHRALEPVEREVAVVDAALAALVSVGILPHTRYDRARFQAHREAVAASFDIPWTAISPRMQRLLYAINAIRQPARLFAAGVFCGYTFIANAGAAVGPGSCYQAEELLGVEIVAAEAERAERNVRRLDPTAVARVVAGDAVAVAQEGKDPIDVLYLDASAPGEKAKSVYLDILLAAWPRLTAGALVLAHNSENGGEPVRPYLEYVRSPARFRASMNLVIDPEGLEVSLR